MTEMTVYLHPEVAGEFHSSVTHIDASGMPVALTEDGWAFHPTTCCGSAVSISCDDGVTYCKGCYGEAPDLFCGEPAKPLRLIAKAAA